MKTIEDYRHDIEERALDFDYYVQQRYDNEDITLREAFIAGAESEYTLLTEWHDPRKELPPIGAPVLLKIKGDSPFPYVVNIRTINPILGEGWSDGYGGILDEQIAKVLGWREIHE